MKISNWLRSNSLARIFIANYIYTIIISIIALILFAVMSVVFFVHKNPIIGRDDRVIHKFLTESYSDLDVNAIIENEGWIETIQDNKIKNVLGNKKDNIKEYTLENVINSYEENTNAEKQLYYSRLYKNAGNIYIVKIPTSQYYLRDLSFDYIIMKKTLTSMEYAGIISIVFIVLALLLVYYKYINRTREPLNQINSALQNIREGNLDIRLNFKGYKEIDVVKDSFNYLVEELQIANKNKEKYEKSKRDMIRDIAHDIKTPITSILGYSKAIKDNVVKSEEERETYLGYIYNKTERLNYLVNQLFLFTKLDTIEYKLNKRKHDLAEFLRNIAAFYYSDIEEAQINLEVYIEDKVIFYEFDNKELERAIGNLITNAIKYNRAGDTIYIELKNNIDKIEILISDNGVGIKEEIKNTIFEAFIRGDISRNTSGGTGLGLSITKKIVENHGGRIILNSTEGKGSEFKIILPK